MTKDYYKILNINRESSQDDIKKAFRKLSKTHHPDKGGDENVFKEMSEAYDTLGSAEKRMKYDHQGQHPFGHGHGHGHGRGGPNMEDVFNQFFGGQQGRRQRQQNIKRGDNLSIPLIINLDDVYFETVKKLKYKRKVVCRTCRGSGGENNVCNYCHGRGQTEQMVGNAFFRQVMTQTCNACNGKGKHILKPCNTCNSEGLVGEDSIIDFKVPGDLMTGQLYTFRSIGNEIANGQNGDLQIEVVIRKHPDFKVINQDLLYEPKIPLLKLITGTNVVVPFFNSSLNVQIPTGSKPGQTFNLRGKGLKRPNQNRGDLYVKPQIISPEKINDKERQLLEELLKCENFN